MVLPLAILIGIFYVIHNKVEDLAEEKAEHKFALWKKHYHKILNFCASLVMLVIGLVLMFL